jgi:hypothetical protein
MQTAIIFNRKDDARRVCRRLRDYCVLSHVSGREVVIEVPTKWTSDRAWELAQKIFRKEA